MDKTFICLANSRKTSGRCIAGKEYKNNSIGGWIRPISERENHEISELDRRYEDGSTAQVFDIINISLKAKANHPAQVENYTIDDGYYWSKQGRFSGNLNELLDTPTSLWANGYSSYNGANDRVPVTSVLTPCQSLYFISPQNLRIIVKVESAEFGNAKKKVRADFHYSGTNHIISITDPEIERVYLAQGIGTYTPTGRIYITVSLGEEWDGYYYKLVAGFFEV